MEPGEADIFSPDEQKAIVLRGAREAAKLAKERYDIDLAKVARDPAEALALVRAFAADKMLSAGSPQEQGAFATLLLNSIGQGDRGQKKPETNAPPLPRILGRGLGGKVEAN